MRSRSLRIASHQPNSFFLSEYLSITRATCNLPFQTSRCNDHCKNTYDCFFLETPLTNLEGGFFVLWGRGGEGCTKWLKMLSPPTSSRTIQSFGKVKCSVGLMGGGAPLVELDGNRRASLQLFHLWFHPSLMWKRKPRTLIFRHPCSIVLLGMVVHRHRDTARIPLCHCVFVLSAGCSGVVWFGVRWSVIGK